MSGSSGPTGETLPGPELASGLHRDLWHLHEMLRARMKERHGRSVPLADELTDRWERARFLGFAKGVSIYDSSLVLGDVTVEEGTWIGPQTILDGSGGLKIGHHCSISAGVHLYSHDTVAWALSGGKEPYVRLPTRVGNCCYIGPHSIVTKGVTIGDHCLIGAHSMVSESLAPNTIAVGVPAKARGRVTLEPDGKVMLTWD